MHIAQFTMHFSQFTMNIAKFTMHIAQFTKHIAQCTIHIVHCTIHSTLQSAQFTLNIVQYTYIAQSTMQNLTTSMRMVFPFNLQKRIINLDNTKTEISLNKIFKFKGH